MEYTRTLRYALAAGLPVLVIIFAFYLSSHKVNAPVVELPTATSTVSITPTQGTPTTPVTAAKMPDLSRPFVPLASLPKDMQAASLKEYNTAVTQLKIDPNHIAYWLQLGILRKGAGDYAGAEEVWLFVARTWPKDPIAYNNLADLYSNYLNNTTKGVQYWQKLITLTPSNGSAYLNLATLQSITLKDTAAARATLTAGVTANPDNTDLAHALEALAK